MPNQNPRTIMGVNTDRDGLSQRRLNIDKSGASHAPRKRLTLNPESSRELSAAPTLQKEGQQNSGRGRSL